MVLKTYFLNLYGPAASVVVLKTYSPNIYRPPTCIAVVKTNTPKHLLACYKLCGTQNRLSKYQQASYTLCSSQNRLPKTTTGLLQALWYSKPTLQISTGLLHATDLLHDLQYSKLTLRNSPGQLRFCGTQSRLSIPLRARVSSHSAMRLCHKTSPIKCQASHDPVSSVMFYLGGA